jgi:hypothetical protein
MKTALKYIGVFLVALVLGIGSALYWLAKSPLESNWVRKGPWKTNVLAGSEQSGMYDRARIAIAGLLALKKSETLYYVADTDDSEELLRAACDYRIEGRGFDARWWSVTVYGRTYFLIPNEQKRYSFNGNNVARDKDGLFRIRLSSTPKDKNWIPTGHKDQKIHVTLRLYNPSPGIIENPSSVGLPRIIREVCR